MRRLRFPCVPFLLILTCIATTFCIRAEDQSVDVLSRELRADITGDGIHDVVPIPKEDDKAI